VSRASCAYLMAKTYQLVRRRIGLPFVFHLTVSIVVLATIFLHPGLNALFGRSKTETTTAVDILQKYRIEGLKGLSHALVISCNATRMDWMNFKMRESVIQPRMFPCVNANSMEWEALLPLWKKRANHSPINSPGALAILATWQKILYRCYHSIECANLIVFEDDVYFHRNFDANAVTTIETARRSHFDVVYLGANCHSFCNLRDYPKASHETLRKFQSSKELQVLEIEVDLRGVAQNRHIYGCYGVLLARNAIERMYSELRHLDRVALPIDKLLEKVYRDFSLKSGIAYPHLVIPEVRESSNMGARDLSKFVEHTIASCDMLVGAPITSLTEAPGALLTRWLALRAQPIMVTDDRA